MKLVNLFFLLTIVFTSLASAQQTYSVGSTEYYYNQTYSTTGKQKVKRSESNKKEFLRSMGYNRTPYGYEIDHIVPLSKGGSDDPSNMQLLTVDQHKFKTVRERSSSSSYNSYSTPTFSSYSNTTKAPNYYSTSSSAKTNKTYFTVPNGGRYYYNSKGNKTYVKKKNTSTYSTRIYKAPTYNYNSTPSYNAGSGRTLQTGARGGTYYVNSNGNKTYVKKN